jgi:hypothetical protein
MTDIASSRPDEYRRYAEECWKFADDAEELESKALFQLTAEAWTMLATQVKMLEDTRSESALESAA